MGGVPPWGFAELFILKEVKVLCFDAVLKVFISKEMGDGKRFRE
jgi:hypothetical protein